MKNERKNFIINCQKEKEKKKLYLGCATKSKIIEMNAQSLEVVFKNKFIISNPSNSPFFSQSHYVTFIKISFSLSLSLAVNLSIEKYHACGS